MIDAAGYSKIQSKGLKSECVSVKNRATKRMSTVGFQSLVYGLEFEFRQRFWGRCRLRKGLPSVLAEDPGRAQEEQFYQMLLGQAYSAAEARRAGLVLDIGCRNWSYVAALTRVFPSARIQGYELDGFRRHWDLYRRIDYACAYAARAAGGESMPRVQCFAGDFRAFKSLPEGSWTGTGPLYCFFYPFVSKDPCVSWGLPERFGDFGSLVQHAIGLAHGAYREPQFFSVHQGEWEATLARAVYLEQGMEILAEGVLPVVQFQHLWPARHDVWWIKSRGMI